MTPPWLKAMTAHFPLGVLSADEYILAGYAARAAESVMIYGREAAKADARVEIGPLLDAAIDVALASMGSLPAVARDTIALGLRAGLGALWRSVEVESVRVEADGSSLTVGVES